MRVARWWQCDPQTWDALDPVTRAEMTLMYEAEQGMERIEHLEEQRRQRRMSKARSRGRRR